MSRWQLPKNRENPCIHTDIWVISELHMAVSINDVLWKKMIWLPWSTIMLGCPLSSHYCALFSPLPSIIKHLFTILLYEPSLLLFRPINSIYIYIYTRFLCIYIYITYSTQDPSFTYCIRCSPLWAITISAAWGQKPSLTWCAWANAATFFAGQGSIMGVVWSMWATCECPKLEDK